MVGLVLVNGEWRQPSALEEHPDGRFLRRESAFRGRVTADGSSGFTAESGRYHLYVSLACPWAHRTLIVRRLKKLEDVISMSIVAPHMGEKSWHFAEPDPLTGANNLYEIYLRVRPDYTGIVTVPTLWDKQQQTIVNNESSEILRMLNSEFDAFTDADLDLYPEPLRDVIDMINADVYENINNGVYKAGFATTQEAYEEAFDGLFDAMGRMEARIASQRYLAGECITEADWRLFTTLVRFDPVYYTHFKCNLHRLVDYPNLWAYTRELYQVSGVAETVDFGHIKTHYYTSHPQLNPLGIIPKGPDVDFSVPHGRG